MRAVEFVNWTAAENVYVPHAFGRHSRAIGGVASSQIAGKSKKIPRF
jgi:hypothetical protein